MDTVADDRLTGEQAIADFLGVPKRRARLLIDQHGLPVAREGDRLVASKAALIEYWQRLTRVEPAQPTERPNRRKLAEAGR